MKVHIVQGFGFMCERAARAANPSGLYTSLEIPGEETMSTVPRREPSRREMFRHERHIGQVLTRVGPAGIDPYAPLPAEDDQATIGSDTWVGFDDLADDGHLVTCGECLGEAAAEGLKRGS
jgi:hypothetical protein